MHQPRPYGLHAIGLPLTERDEAFVASITKRITNLKELSKVDSIKMVYDLPDGGYVIVQDMGGNFRVIAHKPPSKDDIVFSGLASIDIPMLYSGIISKATVRAGEGVGLKITELTRRRINQYAPNIDLPPKDLSLQRFRIDYDSIIFGELQSSNNSVALSTQYTGLRATWYSGAMAEAMQIIGGYGRQDFDKLPDNGIERAQIILPADVVKLIESELGARRLPAYTGIPNRKGQYQYDYKFNRTNAIGFDSNKKPWLLRIGPSGVYAMPLPVIPATTTLAFKNYMEEVGDDEIVTIINRFGGMPSGETFPAGNGFEAWRRAGVIIRVCDASDFYDHIAYSSACGWSLNSKGSEGYNTCYDYYDDEGMGYGLTYKLSLQLAVAQNHLGESGEDVNDTMSSEQAQRVQQYLNGLIPTLTIGTTETNAIFYKLRRSGYHFIHARSLKSKGANDKDYWNNLELDPIADHAGNISEVYRGYLYHPAAFEAQPQIKFPEPLFGACISHNFLPQINGVGKPKPNCNTIMFAYYIGDSLKTIKYFIDWSEFDRKTESNFELYMTEGSWKKVEYLGKSQLQGYFYSSDIDDREVIAPITTTTNIIGEDKGYDTKPYWAFDYPFAMAGTMGRYRYYTHKTNVDTVGGKSLDLAVCIPYLCRNAAIHATKSSYSSERIEELELLRVADPTSYRFWTHHQNMAYIGGDTMKDAKGVPEPEWGSPVWVEEEKYNPKPDTNWADSGAWVSSLPENYNWLINPIVGSWAFEGGGGGPNIQNKYESSQSPSEEKGYLQLSLYRTVDVIHKNVPDAGYYQSSPNRMGNFFSKNATSIVFGESVYHNISELKDSTSRVHFGYTRLADHKSAHCFIGVINE